ncbi:hypothetical protein LCGC14_2439430, partial [marine sediment metagenome]
TLVYTDTTGFKVIDTNGNTKVGGGGGFAAPTGAIDIGDSATEGSLATHSKSDHQHAFTAPSASYPLDVADAEADGSATTPARSDHVHKNMDIGAKASEAGGAETITTGTWTALPFDTDDFDTDTIHDVSSNTERLTATTAGVYVIVAYGGFASDAAGELRGFKIREGGDTDLAFDYVFPLTGQATLNTITVIQKLAAAEYVEFLVFHDKGTDLATIAERTFAMQKIG